MPGTTAGQEAVSARDREHARSWMLPEAKSEDLLYVNNVYTITVYSYPTGKLVGTLSDFYKPFGNCTDSSGDVYITDSSFGKTYVYAHGGTKPIRTLKNPNHQPYGCAVDPITGNVAVTNYSTGSDRTGDVAIYRKGKGQPRSYSVYGFYYYYYAGYDTKGDLFVDGTGEYGEDFLFAELPKGAAAFKQILVDNYVAFPGGVQWDGTYLAVGDPSTDDIYEYAIDQYKGKLEATTPLSGAGTIGQFAIDGSSVVVPNQFIVGTGSNVLYYPYPAGGTSNQAITNGVFYPFAVAISRVGTR